MTPKDNLYKNLWMDVAQRFAQMSHAVRLKVGCVFEKDGQVLSIGWNGMPAKMTNVCETEVDGKLVTKPEVQHAEENAIMKMARSTQSAEGSTVYITHAPCMNCAKLLHGAKVKKVFYREEYRDLSGVYFLRNVGIDTELYVQTR